MMTEIRHASPRGIRLGRFAYHSTMAHEDTRASLPSTLYTEDYFLTACEGYAEFVESHGEHLSRRLKAAFAVASVEPGTRVLDVGCGRGEILRHCAQLGARAYGIDYADVAVKMSREVARAESHSADQAAIGVYRADAKFLPYPDATFDRVLIFDVVEHLFPWELGAALKETRRVLKPGGMLAIHTAPNRWYDRYAYPLVRLVRTIQGKGALYPANPRALNVAANVDVHVNEQDVLSLRGYLKRAGFGRIKVWLDSPPQNRHENRLLGGLRQIAFGVPPFRWFFEREVFAVGTK
jgi:cyclopropane fatty-acyl-phospholipid synthase-like methyltransferase